MDSELFQNKLSPCGFPSISVIGSFLLLCVVNGGRYSYQLSSSSFSSYLPLVVGPGPVGPGGVGIVGPGGPGPFIKNVVCNVTIGTMLDARVVIP